MADDASSSSACTGNLIENSTNQDELIMKQQREIEKEISESIPLVGDLEPLSSLEKEYNEDPVYLLKVKDLAAKYKSIRRTRPDGNCFFRAFSYAYLEHLLTDKQEFDKFYEIAKNSKEILVALGFPQFTVEDFYETFMEVVQRVGEQVGGSPEELCSIRDELHDKFNKQGYSDYIVVYLRLITSGQLQTQHDFYQNFIEGPRTVIEFCRQEVEPMYKESDHIHIIALSNALNAGIRVKYMDRGEGSQVIAHDFPDGVKPLVHLLYRPGHYDILYA
ncbi:ubiquitin thioesterase otubain-like [Pararge aegeria]|uniref:Ubiquitin thioesterase n=4 Tax=Satyrini TaxID=127320 RepID=A0A8S4RTN9_9NEOP|nr:ubiquitin thioesterase otubain-like [Pararge aegeria]CAH2240528.1 jg6443 [Pararge aegeria aegeria]